MDEETQKLMKKYPKQADFISWIKSYSGTIISIRTLKTGNNEVIKTILAFIINDTSYELEYNQDDTCELYYLENSERVKEADLKIKDLCSTPL